MANLLSGLVQRNKSIVKNAKEVGVDGTLFSAPMIAFAIGNAPRGYKLADGLSKGVMELGFTPIATTAAYIGLSCLFPVSLPVMATSLVLSLAISPAADFAGSRLNRTIRSFTDLDRTTQRMQMGFQDTAAAQDYRQMAIREMSGAFSNSRRYLGAEAMYLHR